MVLFPPLAPRSCFFRIDLVDGPTCYLTRAVPASHHREEEPQPALPDFLSHVHKASAQGTCRLYRGQRSQRGLHRPVACFRFLLEHPAAGPSPESLCLSFQNAE